MTFVNEPKFALQVQSRVVRNQQEYSVFRDRVDPYLSKKLQALFLEMWTFPVWRFFDLPLISLPTYVHVRAASRVVVSSRSPVRASDGDRARGGVQAAAAAHTSAELQVRPRRWRFPTVARSDRQGL